jgi:hypothetical protein
MTLCESMVWSHAEIQYSECRIFYNYAEHRYLKAHYTSDFELTWPNQEKKTFFAFLKHELA